MNTDDRALADRLRAMVSSDGIALVCTDRTTRELCTDITAAADRLEAFHVKPVVGERREAAMAFLREHVPSDAPIWTEPYELELTNMVSWMCEFAALQSPPPVVSGEAIDGIAAQILRDMCELPDYDSPDDQPNLIQCTTDELDLIVRRALGDGQ